MESRAGFFHRLLAMLLDGILILIVGGFVGAVLGSILGGTLGAVTAEDAGAGGAVGSIMGGLVGAAGGVHIAAFAFAIWEGITGAAAGKLILGMRIKSADGQPANIGQLLGRGMLKQIFSVMGLLAWLTGIEMLTTVGGGLGLIIFIGCFFALGSGKQALHDMVLQTAVYPKD
jgi:uncharacterized RDD family membrane protein YckC